MKSADKESCTQGLRGVNNISDAIICEAIKQCCEEMDFQTKCDSEAGTTMVSLYLLSRTDGSTRIICSWIGDSKCIMYKAKSESKDGPVLILMTEDHCTELPREKKRIENREYPSWNVLPIEADHSTFQSRREASEHVMVR